MNKKSIEIYLNGCNDWVKNKCANVYNKYIENGILWTGFQFSPKDLQEAYDEGLRIGRKGS